MCECDSSTVSFNVLLRTTKSFAHYLALVLFAVDHVAAEFRRGGCNGSVAGRSCHAHPSRGRRRHRRSLRVQKGHRPQLGRRCHLLADDVPQSSRFRWWLIDFTLFILVLITRTIGEPIWTMEPAMAAVRFRGEVLIAALAPLVGSIAHETPVRCVFFLYVCVKMGVILRNMKKNN